MTKVVALMSMSLDGYVADANDGVAEVFDWYFSGDVEVPTASTTSGMTFRVSAPSADHLRGLMAEVGRCAPQARAMFHTLPRLGWCTPLSRPAFVVTHHAPMAGHGPARQSSSSPTASKLLLLERSRLRAPGRAVERRAPSDPAAP